MIVLDTHAWLWWNDDPARLGPTGREAIERADSIGIASVSCWEVAMLALRGRIGLDRDVSVWVQHALLRRGVVAIPLSPKLAVEAAELDRASFPGDPADRFIYATARTAGALLVTRDARLLEFDPRGTLW